MSAIEAMEHPTLKKMVQDLQGALGGHLKSVVLYGSASRGDYEEKTSDFNLILVLKDLEPATLEALTPGLESWRKKDQPIPRIFSASLIAESADVFPIEFLDIRASHLVLLGEDPFRNIEIRLDHLRLQCERELREKMMRLREGYVGTHARPKELTALLTSSYTTFVALFRGCLHLLGGEVPLRNAEVVAAFCEKAGLDRSVFEDVDKLKRGESVGSDPKAIFARYYLEMTRAVGTVDRFGTQHGGSRS